jgi:hypothetical protein
MWDFILKFLGKISEWAIDCLASRIIVKEIKRQTDKDINDTLELYERLFKDEHRVASADLVAWLRQTSDEMHYTLQHCLLIAKHKKKPVGILKVLYSKYEKYGLICYFGIDKSSVPPRAIASRLLLRFFKEYLDKHWRECDGLAFEIDLPYPRLTKKEKTERIARHRLFKEIAHRHGHDVCKIGFDYFQPKMADNFQSATKERKMGLMLIPIKKCKTACICRPDFDRLLKFLIFGVYGGTQKIARENKTAYDDYLTRLYASLTKDTKDEVQLNG